MAVTEKKIVKRSDKLSFLKVKEKYCRMHGFTSLNTQKNAKEYTRQYVDDEHETTDVVGISTSLDFAFDQFRGDEVHELLVDIIDNEKIGKDAVVTILSVDMSSGDGVSGYPAKERKFTLVPNTEGDSLDAYTYGGTFKVNSKNVYGTATSSDNWESCEFKPKGALEA